MQSHNHSAPGQSLSEEQKRQLDQMIENLVAYANTTEGRKVMDEFIELMERINNRNDETCEEESALTAKEQRVMKFIRKELKEGSSPSSRTIAQTLGLRSSRSGLQMINRLIEKRVIERGS